MSWPRTPTLLPYQGDAVCRASLCIFKGLVLSTMQTPVEPSG